MSNNPTPETSLPEWKEMYYAMRDQRDADQVERDRWQEDSQRQAATIARLAKAAEDRNEVDAARHKMHEDELHAAREEAKEAKAIPRIIVVHDGYSSSHKSQHCQQVIDGIAAELAAALAANEALVKERDEWRKLADWSEIIAILESAGVKREDHGFLRGGKDRTPEDAVRELVSQRDQLRSQLETSQATVRKLTEERDEEHANARRLHSNLVHATAERDQLRATIHNLEQRATEVTAAARDLEIERSRLEGECEQFRKDKERLLTSLQSASSVFDDMDSTSWNEDSDWQRSSYGGVADEVNATLAAMQPANGEKVDQPAESA